MAHLIQPRYTKTDRRTGKRTTRRCRKWYGVYRDSQGRKHRVPLSTDKTAAKAMLAELIRKAEWGEAGLYNPHLEHAARPLTEHLNDWRESLLAKGTSEKQVKLSVGRVSLVWSSCGFQHIGDLSAAKVQSFLTTLRKQKGRSVQTTNFYLSACKGFCRWLVANDRAKSNPLAHLRGGNPKTDRRHNRRALSPDELARLLDAAKSSQRVAAGFSGYERCILYAVAAGTGLRASELASLVPASFVLGDDTPFVRVAAAYTKNRQDACQPLPPVLIPALREFLTDKQAGKRVWGTQWTDKAARMLRHDLRAAGIPYKTDEGYADFHALRTLYITSLCRNGTHPKVAQALARHSTINLTMNTYTRVTEPALVAAVQNLPGLVSPLASTYTEPPKRASKASRGES